MESKVYFSKTQEIKTISETSPEDEVIYPQDWAAANKAKPQLLITYKKLDYKQALAEIAQQGLQKVSLPLVKAALIDFFNDKEELLENDWTATGRTIGRAGERVTPVSLLSVQRGSIAYGGFQSHSDIDYDLVIATLLFGLQG